MVLPRSAALNCNGRAWWMLAGVALMAGPVATAAVSAVTAVTAVTTTAVTGLLMFDIPAQPLTDALRSYSTLTRRATLFRSEMTDDKMSSAVRGQYSAQAALRQLLTGTGLSAEEVDTGPAAAFVLTPTPDGVAEPAPAVWSQTGGAMEYAAVVQDQVWQALCADPGTAPGNYRSLLRFQVDATGRLQRARLLGSTGDTRRDAAMLGTLQHLRLNTAPPPGFPQPLTLFILPHNPANAANEPRCSGDHADGAS